jgi:branched-chain amino acid transport system substrate-binding protein
MRLALIIASIVAGVAKLQSADTAETVIGLLLPPEEAEGAALHRGAMLGVEHANQSPGPRLRLVVRGRTGQWGADGVEAARMVTDDGARGLIAPTDGAASHLVLQVSGRTAVPVVSLCADSSVSQAGVPWIVRVVPQTVEEAKALLTGVASDCWVAVVPDGRAGREITGDLKAAVTATASSLKRVVEVNSTFTNATRVGQQIFAENPDAVLLWLDPATAGRLARSLRAAGFTGRLAGPGRLDSAEFLSAAGDASEGLVIAVPVIEKKATDCHQRFATAFRARFGIEPALSAAMSYDAVSVLNQLLRQTDGQPSHAAFPLKLSITGASGILEFDSQGNRRTSLHLLEAHGGRFTPVAKAIECNRGRAPQSPKLY